MRTAAVVMGLYLSCLLGGQLVWKKGLSMMPGLFTNPPVQVVTTLISSVYIWIGIGLYSFATVLWFYLLSRYEFSFIYPMNSLTFVFAVIVAVNVLEERVPWQRWFGVGLICAGVYLIYRTR